MSTLKVLIVERRRKGIEPNPNLAKRYVRNTKKAHDTFFFQITVGKEDKSAGFKIFLWKLKNNIKITSLKRFEKKTYNYVLYPFPFQKNFNVFNI